MSRILMAAVMGLCPIVATLHAEDAATDKTQAEFLQKAAAGHNGEIQIGKLAGLKSSNETVKAFAAQLVKEHQAAYDELGKLLKTRKIGIFAGLEKDFRDEASALIQLSGPEFDREFISTMVKRHEKSQKLYEAQVNSGGASDVRTYAETTLPAIKHHLAEAKKLQSSLSK